LALPRIDAVAAAAAFLARQARESPGPQFPEELRAAFVPGERAACCGGESTTLVIRARRRGVVPVRPARSRAPLPQPRHWLQRRQEAPLMHPSAPPVRTHHDPIGEASFQELMAERLRQAPWLVASAAAHALVLLLLWVLFPAEPKAATEKHVALTAPDLVDIVEPPPLTPPVTEPEDVPDPVVVDPTVVEDPVETPSEHDSETDRATPSAFLASGDNPALGIGGGAAGPYSSRGPGPRGTRGPRGPTPEAIERALEWLRDHQDADGKWDCDQFMKHDDPSLPASTGAGNAVHDVGVTALALLAFLGDGNTLRSGPYRDTVRAGVLWLRSQQQENGLFGTAASHDFVYDHAIAAYAMCEAFGLSNYQLLRDTAQRGIAYLESHRNPYSVWRYQPRDGDNDTSVTGWCIMAYCAARHFGLQVNDSALQLAGTWLDQVADPTGVHGYSRAGEPSSRKPGDHGARFPVDKGAAMTAVGLFCRYFLGQDPQQKPIMLAAADQLLQKPPVWDAGGGAVDHYYWYYATYALYQMGGPRWVAWKRQIEPVLVQRQHRDRGNRNTFGSWDPACAWGEDGGRVYSTAILALTLQANYRYTRLVR
jgi:hypothetical protein